MPSDSADGSLARGSAVAVGSDGGGDGLLSTPALLDLPSATIACFKNAPSITCERSRDWREVRVVSAGGGMVVSFATGCGAGEPVGEGLTGGAGVVTGVEEEGADGIAPDEEDGGWLTAGVDGREFASPVLLLSMGAPPPPTPLATEAETALAA